jgi:prepilin-type N-terminal cleavage/methylation domain-containing protein
MRIRGDRGFTIVEVSIAMVIVLIFFGAFYSTFGILRNQMYRQFSFFDTNRTVRFGMDRITRDVNEAVSVKSSAGGYSTGDEALVLALPSIDSDGEPTDIVNHHDFVAYVIDSNDSSRLLRVLDVNTSTSVNSQRNGGTDATMVVANSVDTIQFSKVDVDGTTLVPLSVLNLTSKEELDRIHVQITAEEKVGGKPVKSEVNTVLKLRNKLK